MIHVQHDKAGHGYVLTKAKVYVCKCIAEAIIAIGLIASLVFLSIARDNAMGRADAMQAAAEEHKANEERLANELTAAIEQKTDIENALLEEKMQKAELKPEIVEVEVIKEVEVPPLNDYSDIKMTEEERDLLWWVTALEAKEQPDVGQRGVIEVVFNRVQSPDWPNTVEKVLTQKGQFDGYDVLMEYRSGIRSKLYAYPDEKEAKNIDFVLEHGRTALPADYVFFATYKANGSGFLQIADHYFAKASR